MEEDNSKLLNSIFLGEVASAHNYGAFIRIPGNKNQGLVHRSQVSSASVDDVTEVLQKGERVWCKVISITEDGKIGLSMKVVDQGSGRDLDPNGVQIHYRQDEQKRKTMPAGGGRKKISLEAVLKTTCSKCGVAGHMSKDCFQSASGKVYELIPEDDVDHLTLNTGVDPSRKVNKSKKEKKRKKEKKHKKEKKKKKKKESSSSSSEAKSDSDSTDERKRKKRKRDRSRSRSIKKMKSESKFE